MDILEQIRRDTNDGVNVYFSSLYSNLPERFQYFNYSPFGPALSPSDRDIRCALVTRRDRDDSFTLGRRCMDESVFDNGRKV